MKRVHFLVLCLLAFGGCDSSQVCGEGTHDEGGKCVSDDLNDSSCGDKGRDCLNLEGVKDAYCDGDECVVLSCLSDFHKTTKGSSQKPTGCERDSGEKCGSQLIDCKAYTGASDVVCVSGTCRVNACGDGSHKQAANDAYTDFVCIPNDAYWCGGVNCLLKIPHALGVSCKKEECVLERCVTGYFADNGKCILDDDSNCGKMGNLCKLGTHVEKMACVDGSCQIQSCEAGYHPVGLQCFEDSKRVCGSQYDNCRKQHSSTVSCVRGECRILVCEEGYAPFDNRICLSLDVFDCNGVDCTVSEPHGVDFACENQKCVVKTCMDGYWLKDNATCVKETAFVCGKAQKDCTLVEGIGADVNDVHCIDSTCVVDRCANDHYFLRNHACYPLNTSFDINDSDETPDTNSDCGASHDNCTTIEHAAETVCKNKKCKVKKCEDGFKVSVDFSTCVEVGSSDDTVCDTSTEEENICTEFLAAHEHATEIKCVKDKCEIVSCEECYVLNGSDENMNCIEDEGNAETCHANSEACKDTEETSCTSEAGLECTGVAKVKCENGVYIATECNEGYHLKEDRFGCEQDSVTDCGAEHTKCAEVKNADIYCKESMCGFECKEGYEKNNDECVLKGCGEAAEDCSTLTDSTHHVIGQCNNDKCVTVCENKYRKLPDIETTGCCENKVEDNAFGEFTSNTQECIYQLNIIQAENVDFPTLKQVYDISSLSAELKEFRAENLEEVHDLSIKDAKSLNSIAFSNLKIIQGDLIIKGDDGTPMNALVLPKVEKIEGDIDIILKNLAKIDLNKLQSVNGNIYMTIGDLDVYSDDNVKLLCNILHKLKSSQTITITVKGGNEGGTSYDKGALQRMCENL